MWKLWLPVATTLWWEETLPSSRYYLLCIWIINKEQQRAYRIAENFRGRKLREFHGFVPIYIFAKVLRKFSPWIWGMVSFGVAQVSNLQSFSTKIVFSSICESFLPQRFPAIWYETRLIKNQPMAIYKVFSTNIVFSPQRFPSIHYETFN